MWKLVLSCHTNSVHTHTHTLSLSLSCLTKTFSSEFFSFVRFCLFVLAHLIVVCMLNEISNTYYYVCMCECHTNGKINQMLHSIVKMWKRKCNSTGYSLHWVMSQFFLFVVALFLCQIFSYRKNTTTIFNRAMHISSSVVCTLYT